MAEVNIFCPKCRWVPRPFDRWMCRPGCGCIWNTFDTCGVCPQCGRNWEDTHCLACHGWSPHADWYHELVFDGQQKRTDECIAGAPEASPAESIS